MLNLLFRKLLAKSTLFPPQVREQIRKEIREEIEKQRQQVLTDPELKSQLMELEALKRSVVSKTDTTAVTTDSSATASKPEENFALQQDKHKQVLYRVVSFVE